LANRARPAQHWHGHGQPDSAAVPELRPSAALWRISRAVSCPSARRLAGTVPARWGRRCTAGHAVEEDAPAATLGKNMRRRRPRWGRRCAPAGHTLLRHYRPARSSIAAGRVPREDTPPPAARCSATAGRPPLLQMRRCAVALRPSRHGPATTRASRTLLSSRRRC
jgi:hypothetical protein